MEKLPEARPKLATDAFGDFEFDGDDEFEDRKSQLLPSEQSSPAISANGLSKTDTPEPTVRITETRTAFDDDNRSEYYDDDDDGQQLHDVQITDVAKLKDYLNVISQQMGVKMEDAWLAHFTGCLMNNLPVYESHLKTWVSAIKQERSSGAVHDLRDIVSQLAVQVSRLTGQVKTLSDQVISFHKSNQELTESSIRMAESHQATHDNMSWVIDKLKELKAKGPEPVTQAGTVVIHDPPRKHKEKIEALDHAWRKEEITTAFLVAIQTSREEIEDPGLRLAVETLFTPEMMLEAIQSGVPDEELAEVYEMIRKKLEELNL
ncbi:phosphoprotein [Cucurbit cytorhabdovirus 1]|uniref:phosphoprotein n=1 Tax=Cucurbit cytorhabdovirus 1 TaxID=2730538 RepID=UPI002481C510|nr:phosphoprotein [Cucurbit cytorhabdovirus 1]QLT57525.1 phosphoprotein [Cucurbit cytorhabdovirus 1]